MSIGDDARHHSWRQKNSRTTSDESQESALVAAAASGDASALRALIGHYLPLIRYYINGKVRGTTDADDLVQETLIRFYTHLGDLRRADRIGPWLLKIARNEVAMYYRREQRRIQHEIPLNEANSEYPRPPAARIANTASPALHTELTEAQEFIDRAIDGLSDRYRIVLHLRLKDELTSKEIAGLLGLRESAVRMRLKRGLKLLRDRLVKGGFKY